MKILTKLLCVCLSCYGGMTFDQAANTINSLAPARPTAHSFVLPAKVRSRLKKWPV